MVLNFQDRCISSLKPRLIYKRSTCAPQSGVLVEVLKYLGQRQCGETWNGHLMAHQRAWYGNSAQDISVPGTEISTRNILYIKVCTRLYKAFPKFCYLTCRHLKENSIFIDIHSAIQNNEYLGFRGPLSKCSTFSAAFGNFDDRTRPSLHF